MPSAHDEDRRREQPARPGGDRRDRPTQPAHERATQFVDDRRHDTSEDAEAQHASEYVHARACDHEGHEDLHGVGETQREEVAHQGGHPERRRLPVERERHPEAAVGVPQRQVSVVNLGPGQVRPRDHLRNLVEGVGDGRRHAGLVRQSVSRHPRDGTEVDAVYERGGHHHACRAEDPEQTDGVGHPPGPTCRGQGGDDVGLGWGRRDRRSRHLRPAPAHPARRQSAAVPGVPTTRDDIDETVAGDGRAHRARRTGGADDRPASAPAGPSLGARHPRGTGSGGSGGERAPCLGGGLLFPRHQVDRVGPSLGVRLQDL